MEIIKDIAAVVGCVSACIGLIVMIFKPIRKVIIAGITNKQRESEAATKLNQVIKDVGGIKADVERSKNAMLADIAQFQADIKSDVVKIQSDISTLKQLQDDQQKTMDNDEIDRIRWEILSFANGCRYERKHTRNEFEHIISLSEKYERLLEKTGETNGVFKAEYDYIMELYNKCLRENTFLA